MNAQVPDPDSRIRSVRGPLLRWYRRKRRDLPWRRTRDPYAIWVSEVMLQQTQVATVLRYYDAFLERFPDPATLARADEDDVLGAWSGLGYYRRARALQAGARAVAERHGGVVPSDPAALRELPGVGRYTAGAIASIAFDLAEPVLDGNVRRVLARLLAFDASAISRGAEDRALWDVAEDLVRGTAPGDLNQALMELGALVCTPRSPACTTCPVRESCAARRVGRAEAFPVPRAKAAVTTIEVAAAWVVHRGCVLVERPRDGAPLRGRFDLPAVEIGPEIGPEGAAGSLGRHFASRHALAFADHGHAASVRHGIMNRRLRIEVRRGRLDRAATTGDDSLRFVPLEALGRAPVSGATQKIARAVQGGSSRTPSSSRPKSTADAKR